MKIKQKHSGKSLAAFALFGISLFFASTSYAALTDGLVAYYPFDDCTAKDSSGNGNDGIINGNPQCEISPIGKSFNFNGLSDYIHIQHSSSLNMSQTISFGAWVKLTELTGNSADDTIINKEGSPFELAIHHIETTDYCLPDVIPQYNFAFYMNIENKISPCWADGGKKIDKNQWIHLFVTYDGIQIKTYFNGSFVKSQAITGAITNSNEALRIATRGGNGQPSSFLNGSIDEVRIYNRALTAAEITALYQQSNPIQGTAPWKTAHIVTCQNITQNKAIVIPKTKANAWDCEKSGLPVNHGDKVKVTIDGTKY